jgi:hypothetical protein
MPFFKEVWQYTQLDQGFTEVYYSSAADLATAARFSDNFLLTALAFRSPLTQLRKIRVSDVLNPRATVVINVNLSGLSQAAGGPDVASTALIYTLVSTSPPSRRQVWFRGLSDADIIRNASTGVDEPSSDLLKYTGYFVSQLQLNSYCVRSLVPTTTPGYGYFAISSIVVAGPGTVTLNTPVDTMFPVGTRIIISQVPVKEFDGLNGHYVVTATGVKQLIVPYNSALPPGTYPIAKGRLRAEGYAYGIIRANLSKWNKQGKRDTGRNPLGGRGRRSAQVRRSQ